MPIIKRISCEKLIFVTTGRLLGDQQ